ncbi:MAG: ABC transporter substrate-binding protein [Spirochaetes bacterium]|nr:ABC transporter substrate-binding protein [Spirochaetota bacterium]
MKTRKKKSFLLLIAVVIAAGTGISCSTVDDGTVTLVVADNGRDSQLFHIALARLVIENAFDGYRLVNSTASALANVQSMVNGNVDFEVEAWTENNPRFHADVAAGAIIPLGTLLEGSRQGLFVPRFVIQGDPWRGIAPMAPTLARIEDLLRYPHVFPDTDDPGRGRVVGAVSGWHANAILHRKFLHNGLDAYFNLAQPGSETAIFESLEAAYNMGQGWVGYIYEPSRISSRLDLVLLESAPFEPAGFVEGRTNFPEQPLMIVSSRYFPARAPGVADFLRRFATGNTLVSEALAFLEETRATHEQAAIWFLLTHDSLIDAWLPSENAQRLRSFISQI